MKFYFQKEQYLTLSAQQFTRTLVPVRYFECPHCGFFSSETHQELSPAEWQKLNTDFHHYNENAERETLGFNQPPYAEQAMMIALLVRNNLVDGRAILDYAAGYGTLSHLLHKYFNQEISCYDKYIRNPAHHYVDNPQKKAWSMVINSAMFEHILTREDLDKVYELVSDTGALFIHTVVVDRVPNDPNWFYIDVPVHTAVHTNKGMSMLMEQWGFKSSIYSPKSKSWVLLRQQYEEVKPVVDTINQELQTMWLCGKDGFMDYWRTR